MENSIKFLQSEVERLELKTNNHLTALRQIQEQVRAMAIKASKGSLNAQHQLKTLLVKCRLIKKQYEEKNDLIEKLNLKIRMLENNDMTFTVEDVMGFEKALNDAKGNELKVDKYNPLFSNVKFLRVLRTQLEDHEIYEKCALLQKRIEMLNPS